MTGLTRTQAKALAFIRSYIAEHQYSPSFDEIAAGLGLKGKGNIARIIVALRDRGALTLMPNRSRSIRIVDQARPPEGIDFLPEQLAVWVRITAARAGCTPLQVVTECVRDGYRAVTGRNTKPEQEPQNVTRETSPRAA